MRTRFLLDTHALLWLLEDDPRLSKILRQALRDSATLTVSVVSLWEIALKHLAGRIELGVDLKVFLDLVIREPSWTLLPISAAHIAGLCDLPRLHKDPFDRLLVAQARIEDLTLLTADPIISKYPVRTAW